MARTVERIILRHRQWAAAIAKAGWTRSDDPSGHLYGSPGAHRTQWRQWLISPDLRAGEVEKLYDRLCRLIEEGSITRGWAIREFRRLRAHIPDLYTDAHECRTLSLSLSLCLSLSLSLSLGVMADCMAMTNFGEDMSAVNFIVQWK